MENKMDLGKDYNYMMKRAQELEVELGGINTQVYVVDFVADVCRDVKGLCMERAIDGILMLMKEDDIKPYQLSFMRDDLNIFKYI